MVRPSKNVRIPKIDPVVVAVALSAAAIVGWIAYWTRVVPVETASSVGTDGVERILSSAISEMLSEFFLTQRINIVMSVVSVIAGVLATILAALTNPENAVRLRRYSIYLTSIVTLSVTLQTSFHLRDNLDELISIKDEFFRIQTEYLGSKEKLPNDASLDAALRDLNRKTLSAYDKNVSRWLRLHASMGQSIPMSKGEGNPDIDGKSQRHQESVQ